MKNNTKLCKTREIILKNRWIYWLKIVKNHRKFGKNLTKIDIKCKKLMINYKKIAQKLTKIEQKYGEKHVKIINNCVNREIRKKYEKLIKHHWKLLKIK